MRIIINTHLIHRYKRAGGKGWWLGGNYGGAGGMSKHRKSGKTSKSPRLRHKLALEAAKNERKAPPPLPETDVHKLFEKGNSK